MEIIVDDRERAIHDHFETYSNTFHMQYKIERIEVGDYSINYRGYILIVIERKSWKDLAASMRDGRKENVKKLLDIREKTGCQIAYLIEGDASPKPDKSFGRIPYKNLRAHLDHLSFRDGIHMLHAKDEENCAYRIFELAQNYTTIHPSPLKEIDKLITEKETQIKIEVVNKSESKTINEDKTVPDKEEGEEDKEESKDKDEHKDSKPASEVTLLKERQVSQVPINQMLLQCLQHIGSTLSSLLALNGITLKNIINQEIPAETIAVMKYPTGSIIGIERANKIVNNYRFFRNTSVLSDTDRNDRIALKIHIRVLSHIPGLSEISAKFLLKSLILRDIINGKYSEAELAAMMKSTKTKIGPKTAANIIKYLISS